MKVFIGSSREKKELAYAVATWLEEQNIIPVVWSDLSVFRLGGNNWSELIKIAHSVDAAVFIFAADDKTWFRGDLTDSVRDNVILEYGLFSGILSSNNVCFIRSENADIPSDLQGIIYADISKPNSARTKVIDWLMDIKKKQKTQTIAEGTYKLASLGAAFSLVFQNQCNFKKIRIFAISSVRSVQILRSHSEIKINEAVVLLRRFCDNDPYYQESMDKAIDNAIKSWEKLKELNKITELSIPRFDFHPTSGFYIFDDKYLIFGNLSYNKKTNDYSFEDSVLLYDSTTDAGKQFIAECTNYFDNLVSNYV